MPGHEQDSGHGEAYEPTPGEQRVVNRIAIASSLAFVAVLGVGNVTGNWVWMVAYLVALAATLAGFTAWAARTREMSFSRVARAVMRSSRGA